MLFLMILILPRFTWGSNAGSTIFYNHLNRNECWSEIDIARLHARQILEEIIPPQILPDKINNKFIKDILTYFRRSLQTAALYEDEIKLGLKELIADTIGSRMRSEILPSSRFAYYAGYVSYRQARELHDFYNYIKVMLNTQGLGWKIPETVPNLTNLTVEKIRIGNGKFVDSCARLITKRDSKSCIHLPPPKLDDVQKPTAIALPFRIGGVVNLESANSENILMKYYTTASKCILSHSPDTCRHSDFVNFNNELWHWMKRNVGPHLVDEKLYASYGGILRIAAAVQSYGKGLSRRNLFEEKEFEVSKWHPWKTLTESYIAVDGDSTLYVYVAAVFVLVLAMCLVNMCYYYMVENWNGCQCQETYDETDCVDIEYANVDLSIPAMLPTPHSDKRSRKQKTNASTISSTRTQKVYDMHEKKEKIIDILASESESEGESTITSQMSQKLNKVAKETERSSSPPKIETTITEVSIDKKQSRNEVTSSMSFISDSERTCRGTGTLWSDSSSSSSAQSMRSVSLVHQRREPSRTKRYVTKHAFRGKSTSGTEIDFNSCTTPPSKGA